MSARHGEAQSPRSNCHARRTPCAVSSHQYACADRANPSRSGVCCSARARFRRRKNDPLFFFVNGAICEIEQRQSLSKGHAEARRPRVRRADRAGERAIVFPKSSRRGGA
eukprot:2316503-Prymnesium_polylepis.1